MKIDFNKVVNFLCDEDNPLLASVLEVIINAHFSMVGAENKKIKLNNVVDKTPFILEKNKDRLLIYPENYNNISLSNEFGLICEIRCNNNDIELSNIFNVNSPSGIISTTTLWHYDGTNYNLKKGRIVLLNDNCLDIISSKQTIKEFIDIYYDRRSKVFNSLYWDLDLLRKTLLVDSRILEILKENEYSGDKFNLLYKSILERMVTIMTKVMKNTM